MCISKWRECPSPGYIAMDTTDKIFTYGRFYERDEQQRLISNNSVTYQMLKSAIAKTRQGKEQG